MNVIIGFFMLRSVSFVQFCITKSLSKISLVEIIYYSKNPVNFTQISKTISLELCTDSYCLEI